MAIAGAGAPVRGGTDHPIQPVDHRGAATCALLDDVECNTVLVANRCACGSNGTRHDFLVVGIQLEIETGG